MINSCRKKVEDKIQHPTMLLIKIHSKLRMKGKFLTLMKSVYKNPYRKYWTWCRNVEHFSFDIKNEAGLVTTHQLEGWNCQWNTSTKGGGRVIIGKEKLKQITGSFIYLTLKNSMHRIWEWIHDCIARLLNINDIEY